MLHCLATKKYLLETYRKLYSLREKISSSQMPVLPQVHKADPRAPCCSLGSSAFPPGFSFFHMNIFVCLLVFRHPQDIRRTARSRWSALLSSFLGPLAPSPISSFSHWDLKKICSLCQQFSDTFNSAKRLTYFIPWWGAVGGESDILFKLLNTTFFLDAKGKFNIVQSPNAEVFSYMAFSSTF